MSADRLSPRAVLVAASLLLVGAATCRELSAAATAPPAGGPRPAAAPKAFAAVSGPDAEYLSLIDRYTLRDDGAVVHERTARLQLNSYLAINRAYGETKVAYDPAIDTVEVLHNRTVVPSGATIVAPPNAVVDDQPYPAHGNPLWSGLRRKVIVHTALEPGAVVEVGYRVTRTAAASPWLEFAEPLALELPIKERVVVVDAPLAGGPTVTTSTIKLAPNQEIKGTRSVETFRYADVGAIPEEPGTPPRDEALPTLYVSRCGHLEIAAKELARRLEAAGPAPAGAVAVARAAADTETTWETRLLAALESVTKAIAVSRISPSLQHWQPRPMADVWGAGFATPLELATLEARVLEALGFKALPVLLGPPGRNISATPGFSGFDKVALRVLAEDGKLRLYDPAEPTGGGPLEAGRAAPMIVPNRADLDAASPAPPQPWRRDLAINLELQAGGALAGTLALATSGSATPHAALVRDVSKVAAKLVPAFLTDGKAKDIRVTSLARTQAALSASIAGKASDKNAAGLVRIEIGGVPGGLEKELPPLPVADRHAPIALPAPGSERIELVLTVPKGWKAAALPLATKVDNMLGTVEVTAGQDATGTIKVVRRCELVQRVAKADQARETRALVAAWNAPATRTLLLRPGGKDAAKETP